MCAVSNREIASCCNNHKSFATTSLIMTVGLNLSHADDVCWCCLAAGWRRQCCQNGSYLEWASYGVMCSLLRNFNYWIIITLNKQKTRVQLPRVSFLAIQYRPTPTQVPRTHTAGSHMILSDTPPYWRRSLNASTYTVKLVRWRSKREDPTTIGT